MAEHNKELVIIGVRHAGEPRTLAIIVAKEFLGELQKWIIDGAKMHDKEVEFDYSKL